MGYTCIKISVLLYRLLVILFLKCNLLTSAQQCQIPAPYTNSFPDQPFGCILRPDISIITITHGGQSDAFWYVVQDAVLRAGEDLRVKSSYRTTPAVDYQGMAQLIYDAIKEKPDGLVVSMPDPETLGPPVKAAIAAGIPVITINSGSDVFESLGVVHHVGQVEDDAGYKGCHRIMTLNPRVKIILIPDVESLQNVGVNARSAGCKKAAIEMGADATQFGVSKVLELHTAKLQEQLTLWLKTYNSSQIGILGINPMTLTAASSISNNLALKPNSLTIGIFDFSDTAGTYLANGFLSFAIHQQQYLQGYLPVVMLSIYASTKNLFAKMYDDSGKQIPLYTGPQFITGNPLEIHQRGCESSGIIYCDDPPKPDTSVHLKYSLADTTKQCPCINRQNVNIGFVHHGGLSDSFWWVVQNAAAQAADDMGITLQVKTPLLRDDVAMLSLALGLIQQSPQIDGLVMTIPGETFQTVIKKAKDIGIPIIAINAGLDVWQQYGADMFVGQEDYAAGYQGSGQLDRAIRVDRHLNMSQDLFLCLDGSSGTVGSVLQRCNATRRWLFDNHQHVPPHLKQYSSPPGMVYLDGSNPTSSKITLANYMSALNSSCPTCKVSGIVASGDTDCLVAQRIRTDSKIAAGSDPFHLACFDCGGYQIQGLLDGTVDFAIDQQQWLQGYFPVVFLTLKALNGNYPAFDLLYTGPGFLAVENVPYKKCENLYDKSDVNQHYVGWKVCPRPNPFSSIIENIHKGIEISVCILCAMLLVVIIGTSVAFFHYKDTKLIKASTMVFCQMMLFFMVLMLVSAVLFVINPTPERSNLCCARPWVLVIGILGVLSPLFAKTSRLAALFNNEKMKKIKITNKKLLLEIGKALGGAVVVLIVWFAMNTPQASLVEVLQTQKFYGAVLHTTTTYQEQCVNDMRFVWVLAAYILLYVLYGSYLAYQTRNVPEAFNESKSIGVSLYFILIMGALSIGLLFLVKTNRNAVAVLIGYGLVITVLTVWSALFGTKLVILFKGQGDQVAVSATTVAVGGRSGGVSGALKSGADVQIELNQLRAELKEAQAIIAEMKKQLKEQNCKVVPI